MNRGEKVRLTDGEYSSVKAVMHAELIAQAKAKQPITYSELASRLPVLIHPHSFVFSRLLREVCAEAFSQGHGQLCALVVSKQTGMPSSGYFVGVAAPGRDMSDLETAWHEDLDLLYARWEDDDNA